MNPERWEQINTLCSEALERDKENRATFLEKACAGDAELRVEVERLLGLHEEAGDFLESPAIEVVAKELARQDSGLSPAGLSQEGAAEEQIQSPVRNPSGIIHVSRDLDHPEFIGPYKIREVLGEGGMGVVYLAEQTKPMRRRVALKVIKLGMDTREVIARFQSELQALALMSHPNIAMVIDAGKTDRGSPYFVMEYVPGIQIRDFCDQRKLSTRARLELFIPVCQAIQHAHQRGIIHRDIKPSNVLVSMVDGKPLPKVIDFGIAKATGQRLTEETFHTQHGVIMGTPEYMSPEQADMSGFEIDSTTDIYALGVILYELLVGALPIDSTLLRKSGYDQMRRLIREGETLTPANRLKTLGKAAEEAAKHRRTDVNSLVKHLRGALDCITMKAIEKDRSRRYKSAAELEADIRCYLNGESVHASPPGMIYRLGKFPRKVRLKMMGAIMPDEATWKSGVLPRFRVSSWLFRRSYLLVGMMVLLGGGIWQVRKSTHQSVDTVGPPHSYRPGFNTARLVHQVSIVLNPRR